MTATIKSTVYQTLPQESATPTHSIDRPPPTPTRTLMPSPTTHAIVLPTAAPIAHASPGKSESSSNIGSGGTQSGGSGESEASNASEDSGNTLGQASPSGSETTEDDGSTSPQGGDDSSGHPGSTGFSGSSSDTGSQSDSGPPDSTVDPDSLETGGDSGSPGSTEPTRHGNDPNTSGPPGQNESQGARKPPDKPSGTSTTETSSGDIESRTMSFQAGESSRGVGTTEQHGSKVMETSSSSNGTTQYDTVTPSRAFAVTISGHTLHGVLQGSTAAFIAGTTAAAIYVASITLKAGGPAATIFGTPVSLGSSGIVIASSTYPIPSETIMVMGSKTFAIGSATIEVSGTTLSDSHSAITVQGMPISLGPMGLVVAGSVIPYPTSSLNAADQTSKGLGGIILAGFGPSTTTSPSDSIGSTAGTNTPGLVAFAGAATRIGAWQSLALLGSLLAGIWTLHGFMMFESTISCGR